MFYIVFRIYNTLIKYITYYFYKIQSESYNLSTILDNSIRLTIYNRNHTDNNISGPYPVVALSYYSSLMNGIVLHGIGL